VICHASVASSHTALHSSLSERTGCEVLMWAGGGGAEERECCCVSGRRLEGSGTSRCGDCFRGLSLRAASWMPRGVRASGGSTAAMRGEWVLRGTVGKAGAPLVSAYIQVVVWPSRL